MEKIKDAVIRCHNQILKECKINKQSSIEMPCTRDNGISSLGIVNLILLLEEELDINLDNYLMSIRECKTIGDIVKVIEDVQ